MSARGLDFGSGMSQFADLIARGHKDRIALDQAERERAEKIRQFEIEKAQRGRQLDYLYPEEMEIAPFMLDTISEGVEAPYMRGVQSAPKPPPRTPPIIDRATGKRVGDANVDIPPPKGKAADTRQPGGMDREVAAAPGAAAAPAISDKTLNLARSLGIEIRDGRMIAKGRKAQEILDLYKATLGAQASVFSAGARDGRPQYVQPYGVGATPAAPRPPKDQRLDILQRRIEAAKAGIASFGKYGAMMDENKAQIDAYRQEINAATREMEALSRGEGGPVAPGAPAQKVAPGTPLPGGGKEPSDDMVQKAATQWKMSPEAARVILRNRMNSGR